MDRVFDNYIKAVQTITEMKDSKFYDESKIIFFKSINQTLPRNVEGIVVGMFPHSSKHIRCGSVYISTGDNLNDDDCDFIHDMVNDLKVLKAYPNLVWVRFPFISTHKEKTDAMISAFKPVLCFILHRILNASRGEFEKIIPILTLGKNSYECVIECLKQTNRPKFVTVPCVHPNFMRFCDDDIKNTSSQQTKIKTMNKMYHEYDKFKQSLMYFTSMLK